jgi:hypothetical protein
MAISGGAISRAEMAMPPHRRWLQLPPASRLAQDFLAPDPDRAPVELPDPFNDQIGL